MLGRVPAATNPSAFFESIVEKQAKLATISLEKKGVNALVTTQLLKFIQNDKVAWHEVVANSEMAHIVKSVAHELPGVLDVVDDKGRCA